MKDDTKIKLLNLIDCLDSAEKVFETKSLLIENRNDFEEIIDILIYQIDLERKRNLASPSGSEKVEQHQEENFSGIPLVASEPLGKFGLRIYDEFAHYPDGFVTPKKYQMLDKKGKIQVKGIMLENVAVPDDAWKQEYEVKYTGTISTTNPAYFNPGDARKEGKTGEVIKFIGRRDENNVPIPEQNENDIAKEIDNQELFDKYKHLLQHMVFDRRKR